MKNTLLAHATHSPRMRETEPPGIFPNTALQLTACRYADHCSWRCSSGFLDWMLQRC